MDEERMRTVGDFPWLGLVLCRCWLGDRKVIQPVKKPVPLILKGSLLEQVKEEAEW